ncbi:MAG TPA: DnaJ domain-containing protein [Kofleriaceae bacterium]|nr:DnaJ domain-containing protein [Kofleriaceae bacterium]
MTGSPRLNPDFRATAAAGLSSEDYYVLSRVDGRTSLHDLVVMTGFSVEKAIGILVRLHGLGAFLIGSETPTIVRERLAAAATAAAAQQAAPPDTPEQLGDADLTAQERDALAAELHLSDAERRRMLLMMRKVKAHDYLGLLGVSPDSDKRALKRAYFKVSKEFHPDRYYGRTMGVFGPWLATIFEASTMAYETLSDPAARARYESSGAPAMGGAVAAPGSQSKEQHAASLFQQACSHEVRGELTEALRLFAAVCRMDPQIRHLRRAARCALAAPDLPAAKGYVNKAMQLAHDDPSVARLSADVYRAEGKLEDAEREILRALGMRSENDVLDAELQQALAAIRKLRGVR